MTMTFNEWLAKYQHRNDATGDLARDVALEEYPTAFSDLDAGREHLKRVDAIDEAIATYERAYRRYKKHAQSHASG